MQTNQLFAVKVIRIPEEEDGVSSTTLRELSILQSLSHPSIVKLEHYKLEMLDPNPRI